MFVVTLNFEIVYGSKVICFCSNNFNELFQSVKYVRERKLRYAYKQLFDKVAVFGKYEKEFHCVN